TRLHQPPPPRPPPAAPSGHQPVARTQVAQLPPGLAHPRRPAAALQSLGRAPGPPAHAELPEIDRPPVLVCDYLPNLPRTSAEHSQTVERDLASPLAAERQPPSRGPAREVDQPPGA